MSSDQARSLKRISLEEAGIKECPQCRSKIGFLDSAGEYTILSCEKCGHTLSFTANEQG